jgi:hypothetical protein
MTLHERIIQTVWKRKCNSCDCENAPECPENETECIAIKMADNIVKAISKIRGE